MGTPTPREAGSRLELLRSAATGLVMALLVVAVYVPVGGSADDNTIWARDYHRLHARRISFAQEALFNRGTLPAWYPHELLGTPFWSNVQNFPFIPTRLVLLGLDPLHTIIAGAILSAVLAALFTFAFARHLGMTRVGAAAAGWTFACAGFYASRVMAGHLPLLEAYPALPLLLWRVEACLRTEGPGRLLAMRLGVLALAVLCAALAGHPQLFVYAMAVAGLYLVFRGWKRWRLMLQTAAAMALGVAAASFALLPMAQLVGRSTRVLPLGPAGNDIPFPYGRLLAFILPWHDQSSGGAADAGTSGASGAASSDAAVAAAAYFWDTVCYVGWTPLLATLAVLALARRVKPDPRWTFLFVLGALALVTALPAIDAVRRELPGTFLRSSARQVYVTTFALALAAGVGIDLLVRHASRARRWPAVVAAVILFVHLVDLGWHDRWFVQPTHVNVFRDPPFEEGLRTFVGDGRIGIDNSLMLPFNRELDDVGFFDSIMLAKPYTAVMDLIGAPPGTNVQEMDGSEMSARALAATGTRLVMTMRREWPDLKLLSGTSALRSYAVPGAQPRAAFYPAGLVDRVNPAETHRRLRDPAYDVAARVTLPLVSESAPLPAPAMTPPATTTPAGPLAVGYDRPSTDEIVLNVAAPAYGVVRVLESWDPGWSAYVGGLALNVECADDAFLAVELPPGQHELRLTYTTPGAATGVGVSLASLLMLTALLVSASKPVRSTKASADRQKVEAALEAPRVAPRASQRR